MESQSSEPVYDLENRESRPQLTDEEMSTRTLEELQDEQRQFGCENVAGTSSASAQQYCGKLEAKISEKAASAGYSLEESAKKSKNTIILENHKKGRAVHPVAKKQWWYDA